MRWQVGNAGQLPSDWPGKIEFVFQLFLNPWIISSILATFVAGVSWMLTMTKFDISYAYPWISLNFVIMLLIGNIVFNEPYSTAKVVGTLLILGGVFVIGRG